MFIKRKGRTGHGRRCYQKTKLSPNDLIFVRTGGRVLFKRKVGDVIFPMYLEKKDIKIQGPKQFSKENTIAAFLSSRRLVPREIYTFDSIIKPEERGPNGADRMYEKLYVLEKAPQ